MPDNSEQSAAKNCGGSDPAAPKGQGAPSASGGAEPAGGARRASGASTPPETRASAPAEVRQRTARYLMAPRAAPGQVQPMAVDTLQQALENMADVLVLRRLKPRGLRALAAGMGGGGGTEVIVAEMTPEKGALLQSAGRQSGIIVEKDELLRHHDTALDTAELFRNTISATLLPPKGDAVAVRIQVLGAGDQPLRDATVIVYGHAFPAQGRTDDRGQVELALFGGGIDSVGALYVKPAANHWERFVVRPSLAANGYNTIRLDPLDKTFPGFPGQAVLGWGQRIMGLDRLPKEFDGRGVKVAIIDSGVDVTHPQLTRAQGCDLTTEDNSGDGWKNDVMGHGTHCAGIIGAAAADRQAGIRGFAPGAEIHALKVFPEGRFSDLIEALDLCIEREIDVVNLSLGSPQPSELVQQKIIEATANGVACIVAAGNSADAVQFPGTLGQVYTVGAIGQLGQFPTDTYHAQTVFGGVVGPDSVFSAKFSCFGPQIRVAAPGVAILSTVPGGYAAWDGTSMATPHVTGLAALVVAHHPAFAGRKDRSAQRVDTLFRILTAAAIREVFDPLRGGAGLPVATQVFADQLRAQTGQAAATGAPEARPGEAAAPIQVGQMPVGGVLGGPYAGAVPSWRSFGGYTGLMGDVLVGGGGPSGQYGNTISQAASYLLQLLSAGLI